MRITHALKHGGASEWLEPRRLLPACLGLALLLHVPLAPLVDFSRLAQLFRSSSSVRPPALVHEIPVDLLEPAAERVAPAPEPARGKTRSRAPRPVQSPPESAPRTSPPPVPPARADALRAEHEEPAIDSIATIGGTQLVDSSAALRVLLHLDQLRGHAWASDFSAFLGRIEQWQSLFASKELDPLRDLERVLIAAPSLQSSRSFVAIVDYNVPRFRVRQAIARGRRAEPELRAAAFADPAAHERTFAFPSPRTLVIAPRAAERAAAGISRRFRLPEATEGELLSAHLRRPARFFENTALSLPSTLRGAELKLEASAGAARLRVLCKDANNKAAASSAAALSEALGAPFVAERDTVRGELILSRAQLSALLGAIAPDG